MKPHANLEDYSLSLSDIRWKRKAETIKKRDNYKCRNCFSSTSLNVHHRAYLFIRKYQTFLVPWNYPDSILITLCKKCHDNGHNNMKVPIKYI